MVKWGFLFVVVFLSGAAKAEFIPYASIVLGMQHGRNFNQGTVLTGANQLQDAVLIEDYGSYVGFRGTEKWDDKIHWVWQFEQYFTIDNSTVVPDKNTFANKDSFVGLIGDFGSFRAGRLATLPKSELEYVDPWAHDGKGVNGLAIFTRLDWRLNNAIKYETPGYFGAKLALLYSPDEAKDANGKAKDVINAAILYKDATYIVGYSYYLKNNTFNGTGSDVWHRAEVAFDQKIWMLALGYQSVKGSALAFAYNPRAYAAQKGAALVDGQQKIEGAEYSATLNYTFQEKLTYRLSYAQGSDLKVDEVKIADSGYSQIVFGATYQVNEKAKTFLNYGRVDWRGAYSGTDTKIYESVLSLGMGLDI